MWYKEDSGFRSPDDSGEFQPLDHSKAHFTVMSSSLHPPVLNSFYQADPAAHVWKCDPSRVWIHGSHDWNRTVVADNISGKYDMNIAAVGFLQLQQLLHHQL